MPTIPLWLESLKVQTGRYTSAPRTATGGNVVVCERGPTGWTEVQTLSASDAMLARRFGEGLAVNGDDILVGTWDPAIPTSHGTIYAFERGAAGWTETQKISPSVGTPGEGYGKGLAMNADRAIVGSHRGDHSFFGGELLILEKGAMGWAEAGTVPSFGSEVRLSGNQVLNGNMYAGQPSLYSLGIDQAQNVCTSSPNSTGAAAVMEVEGCDSRAANALTLRATGLPPGSASIFFHGPNTAQFPLGNGTMCIGLPRQRLGLSVADASGVVSRTIEFADRRAEGIAAGSLWQFQAYYRDAGTGAGFDLTDAVEVGIQH